MKKINTKKEKNLEEEIIKKVYSFEKKRTSWSIFKYMLLIVVLAGSVIFLTYQILAVLSNQATLDLLEIFQEDMDVIKANIWDVLQTFYAESPLELFTVLFVFIVVLSIVLFFFVRNFAKIKNRAKTIFFNL